MRLGGLDHDIIVDESPAAGRASSALLDRKHPAYKPLFTGIDQNSGGATEGHDQRHTFMVYIRRAAVADYQIGTTTKTYPMGPPLNILVWRALGCCKARRRWRRL